MDKRYDKIIVILEEIFEEKMQEARAIRDGIDSFCGLIGGESSRNGNKNSRKKRTKFSRVLEFIELFHEDFVLNDVYELIENQNSRRFDDITRQNVSTVLHVLKKRGRIDMVREKLDRSTPAIYRLIHELVDN